MSYSDKETAAVRAAAPLTYAKAVELAAELGKSTRSVISKAKSLDLEYTPKPKAAAKGRGVTKAAVVLEVASALQVDADAVAGLAKADMAALKSLLAALKS